MMDDLSFLRSMDFWAVVTACLSLAISIWPKVKAYFKGVRIDIEVNSEIALSQRTGYTNLNWFVSLVNSGGADVRVKKIYITLTHDGVSTVIPGRNYYKTFETTAPALLVPFSLKTGEEVGHTFGFFPLMTRHDERHSKSIDAQVRKETQGNESGQNSPTKVLSPETHSALMKIFNDNYVLTHGEYHLKIAIEVSAPKSVLFERELRFTLYESDEKDLRGLVSGYITGDGITYFSSRPFWFNIPLVHPK